MNIFVLDDEVYGYPRSQILDALSNHNVTAATSCVDGKLKYRDPYKLLLLDHDMRGRFEDSNYHNTGYRFCEWLVARYVQGVPKPQVILHSQNPFGRTNMRGLLEEANFQVVEHPFSQAYVELLKTL